MRYVPSAHDCRLIYSFDDAGSTAVARWNVIIAMIYATGAGLSELAALRADDVTVSGKLVSVAFDGRRRRVVPLHSHAGGRLRSLLALYAYVPQTRIFDWNGRRLSETGLRRELIDRGHQLGLPGVVTSGGLRLACIRDLLASGMPAEAVGQLLGAKELNRLVNSVQGL